MKFFPWPMPPEDTLNMIQRIKNHFNKWGYGLYAVDYLNEDKFIGFIGIQNTSFESFFTPSVELAYRLDPKYWRKGLASEGSKACLNHFFESKRESKVVSFTSIHNLPSLGVMMKIGMKRIGEFEHPKLKENDRLRRHVLYEIGRDDL